VLTSKGSCLGQRQSRRCWTWC